MNHPFPAPPLAVVDGREAALLEEEVVRLRARDAPVRVVDEADVRLGAHELDRELGEEAERAVRPRHRVEELRVGRGRHRVDLAVRVDKLVRERGLLEEAVAV